MARIAVIAQTAAEDASIRHYCGSLLHELATAIERGHDDDLQARLIHTLFWVEKVKPGTVPTLTQWLENEYAPRVAQCRTVFEAIALRDELNVLANIAAQLEREACAMVARF